MSVDQTWLDRNAAWSAMLDRTDVHLRSLRIRSSRSKRLTRTRWQPSRPANPIASPTGVHVRRLVPVAISTIIGGIVYNLRPALDSLAYEMAVRHIGRPLKDPPTGAALSQNGNDERSRLRIPLGPRTRSAP